MNYLNTYEFFLNERKQVGILYHFTSFSSLSKILESNSLKSYYPYISFTRNKNFEQSAQVRIVVNGDNLSDKYKIEPFSFGKAIDNFGIPIFKSEAEERILLEPNKPDRASNEFICELKNIKKYIIRIDILDVRGETFEPYLDKMIKNNSDVVFRRILPKEWNKTLKNIDVDRLKKI